MSNHRIKYKPIEVGDRFGRLVVLSFIERRRGSGTWQLYWRCQCSCGSVVSKRDASLKNGNTRSCGCLQRESAARADWKTVHGEASNGKESVEYQAWRGMFRRVNDKREGHKRCYADRGIAICFGLRDSYLLFLRLLGRKPTHRHSLDRVNNNGRYSCGECAECIMKEWPFNLRWATAKEQAQNSRHQNQWTGPAPVERIA